MCELRKWCQDSIIELNGRIWEDNGHVHFTAECFEDTYCTFRNSWKEAASAIAVLLDFKFAPNPLRKLT